MIFFLIPSIVVIVFLNVEEWRIDLGNHFVYLVFLIPIESLAIQFINLIYLLQMF